MAHQFAGELTALRACLVFLANFSTAAFVLGFPAPSSAVTLDDALRHLRSEDVLIADAAVEEIVAAGPPAADSLLLFLGDPRRDVRAGALRGLGLLGDPRAAVPIRAILESSLSDATPDTFDDRYFRILAIQALGRLKDEESRSILERAAQGDAFETAHAAVALFHLAVPNAPDLLRASFADTTSAIRGVVVEGLGEDRSADARVLLLEATKDVSWTVRDSAFRGLRGFPMDPEIQAALARGATDASWLVRATVAEGMAARRSP